MQPNASSVFVVVDIWRGKSGKRDELRQVLTDSGALFRARPGVLSVDFTLLEDDPDRYLVVFRYESAEARETFVATDELRATLSRLSELWDLESPVYKGTPAGF